MVNNIVITLYGDRWLQMIAIMVIISQRMPMSNTM